jgi:uncharacterized protein YebE (UPF0316 family)
MSAFLSALLIFSLRVVDVSIDTVRIVFLIQGRRWLAGGLGLVQAFVFIFAVAQVLRDLDDPARMVGYAVGFATGTVLGSSIERWIGMGQAIIRVIVPFDTPQVASTLRASGFGVTVIGAEGLQGPVRVTLVVVPRRRTADAIRLIRRVNPEAFVTIESTSAPDLPLRRIRVRV